MKKEESNRAFGAPGMEPRWSAGAKDGVGTAYHTGCRLWFTLNRGIVGEVYYPTIDQPCTRDLQLLVSDGATFCHDEKRDFEQTVECPRENALYYRLTNHESHGRYRLVKDVITDPHRSVLLMRTRLEILDESLRGKLHVYALLAPHIAREGRGNTGWTGGVPGQPMLCASRAGLHLALGSSAGFGKRSAGYVGHSDGWQDLMENFQMDWEFTSAPEGNIALTGEIPLDESGEFVLALAFGRSEQGAETKVLQSLADPFDEHLEKYVEQWQRAAASGPHDLRAHTGDDGSLFRLSRCVLLAHEDKVFQGATIAALSIPWGETKGDEDLGGYHLVWTRDLLQTATALLATGQTRTPQRALLWLASVQQADGSFPQNCWLDGQAYWKGVQLDETAAPILLAWRLHEAGALGLYDPWPLIREAARFLIHYGPVTQQERWEENAGYSPSTLAQVTAALVCAAQFALARGEDEAADFLLFYADWLSAHIESWTVTSCGDLHPEIARHFIRITPADPAHPTAHPDPDTARIQIANGGGEHLAREIVGGDFLHLVRLGLMPADDPLVCDSVAVLDRVLRHDLPPGPSWRRYNYDGYGQKDDGNAFDGTGVGRCWPLLAGERGHYELAAGRDPLPFIRTMERSANRGGMIPEQIWDGVPFPHLAPGGPTGSAVPLCWSHAEYLSLVRSRHDGRVFDRIEPVWQRYTVERTRTPHEIWTPRHRLETMTVGTPLRLLFPEPGRVIWSTDGWSTQQETLTRDSSLAFSYLDFSSLPPGPFQFRFEGNSGHHESGEISLS